MLKNIERLQKYWPLLVLILFFSLFYLKYINLFNSDIGRHIANGREIVAGSQEIFNTNYYSFTQTDFPTINHHWFFGVIVFYLHELGGFKLLTWFNLFLNTSAFGFILASSVLQLKKKNNLGILFVLITGFLFMPLITSRAEVRPESLSLLFFSLFHFLFSSKLILKKKWLLVLVFLIQIVWVNSHLFFILGPLLAGYFLFENLAVQLFEKNLKNLSVFFNNTKIRFWLVLSLCLFVLSIVNPHGVTGMLAPFQIFNNYEYRVAENQSTFFMISYGAKVALHSYIVFTSFLGLVIGLSAFKNKNISVGEKISQLLLLGIFIFLANKINRMAPFFAVLAIPFIVKNSFELVLLFYEKYKQKLQDSVVIMFGSFIGFALIFLILQLKFFTPNISGIGHGLLTNTQTPAHFFIENNLKGPVFNNYDIGGYLAYNLFPQEKLFIDNRPEAYSGSFLKNEYSLSLNDEIVWEEISNKYNLNVIFFYRHDMADGAQSFLYNRVVDETWVPVFVDLYTIIFVKNSPANHDLITKFELPKEIFNQQ